MFIVAVTIVIALVKKLLIPAFAEEAPNKQDSDHIEKFDKAFENLKGSITQMEEVIDEVSSAEKDALKFAEEAASTVKHGKKIIKQVSKIKEEKETDKNDH